MKLLYQKELEVYLSSSKEEVIQFGKELINSKNANNWQRCNELSFLLRRNNRTTEAAEISKYMFESDPTVNKLNLYFVATVDGGDIKEIQALFVEIDEYLKQKQLGYQKHLFATWLKAANRILDDEMFQYVYNQIPSTEKTQNSFIISQNYVYLNRHSMYENVIDHYEKLEDNVRNSNYVNRYYLNACSHMGLASTKPYDIVDPQNFNGSKDATNSSDKSNLGCGKVFIVHGHDPEMLGKVEKFLSRCEIIPVVLQDIPGVGCSTIIEEFERNASTSDYAIILASPDDELSNGKFYCRQNVIFEFGYFVAKLTRARVSLIYKEKNGTKPELPSDIDGVKYLSFGDGSWMLNLGQRLKESGYKIDFNRLFE